MKRLTEEVLYHKYLLEYNELMVNKGLYHNYKQKLREFKATRKDIEGDINTINFNIDVMIDQMKNGVEVKKAPAGVG